MRIKINAGLPLLLACTSAAPGAPDGSIGLPRRYPPVPNGKGPTLGASRLVTVTYAGDARAGELTGFSQWLAASGWLIEAGGEYGVRAVQSAAPVTLPGAGAAVLTIDDVKALITGAVLDGGLPVAASGEAPYLFVLHLPPGTVLTDSVGNLCRSNPGAGTHDATPGAGQAYVVVPPCPARFSATLSAVESEELDTARLVLDALTDPSPRDAPAYALTDTSSPWAAMGSEVGDFCWGRLFSRDGHTLQRTWSNAAAAAGGDACVPVSPGVPFGVSVVPATLQTLQVATPADFTVTGWAQGSLGDWALRVTPWVGDFAVTAQLDRSTLNAGESAQLSITVPFAVPAGTYGAVLLQSKEQEDAPEWPVSFVVQ